MYDKIKYRIRIIKRVFPHAKGFKKYFWLLAFLNLLSMATGLITPQFYKLFVDDVILDAKTDLLIIVISGYLGLFALDTLLAYLSNYVSNSLVNNLLLRIRQKIFDNFLTMPMTDIERENPGDLQMKIDDDTNKLAGFPSSQIIRYTISYINLIIAAVILFTIEWRLTLFSVIIIPLTFYIDHVISKKEMYLHDFNRENDQNMMSWMQNSINGWKEIKALNLQKHEVRTFASYLHNFARFYSHWIYYWTARALVIPKIKDDFLMQFALYFLGGLLIINGSLSIGSLLVFMMYYRMLSNNVNTVSGLDADLQSNKPFFERILNELRHNGREGKSDLVPEKDTDVIEFKNVTFSYPQSNNSIIENFNMIITPGERVAITGRSGTGKTTIIKLLMGIIQASRGSVLFSGTDIGQIDLNYLYQRIGCVMQENMLFNLSIRDNLLMAKSNASEAELEKACREACIFEFINSLPEKYDTVIGEMGVKLSGGQRQRIVLARLFLQNVDILIFDEATSSLDQYSESIIHEAINAIGRDKTILVVAHRESSISLCDRVIEIG